MMMMIMALCIYICIYNMYEYILHITRSLYIYINCEQ